jgi:rod shape-determining protein MreD
MVRSLSIGALLAGFFVIAQSSMFVSIPAFLVIPDFALIVLVFFSIQNGSVQGAALGFIVGIGVDSISSAPLGYHSFALCLVAYLVGLLKGKIFIGRLVFPFLSLAIATLVKAIASNFLALLAPEQSIGYDFMDPSLWIELGANAALAPLLFLLISPLKRALTASREDR